MDTELYILDTNMTNGPFVGVVQVCSSGGASCIILAKIPVV